MFSKKKNYSLEDSSTTIIAEGTELVGDIKCEGSMRFDGIIRGDIIVRGRLVVGTTARIEGSIKSYDTEIGGKVEGNVAAEELVTLQGKCSIMGDITTKKLIVESGALFNGKCFMGENASNIPGNKEE